MLHDQTEIGLDDFPVGAVSTIHADVRVRRVVVGTVAASRKSDRRDRAMRWLRGVLSAFLYIASMIFNALALSFLWAAERLEGDF